MKNIASQLKGLFQALLLAACCWGMVSANAAPKEDDPVWRLQLEVSVANVGDAGTDDPVFVQFGNGKRFIMNYGHDDFERGSRFMYDLMPNNVQTVGDIQSMRIFKERDNGLALKALKLLVNGVPIFTRDYGASPHWSSWRARPKSESTSPGTRSS